MWVLDLAGLLLGTDGLLATGWLQHRYNNSYLQNERWLATVVNTRELSLTIQQTLIKTALLLCTPGVVATGMHRHDATQTSNRKLLPMSSSEGIPYPDSLAKYAAA